MEQIKDEKRYYIDANNTFFVETDDEDMKTVIGSKKWAKSGYEGESVDLKKDSERMSNLQGEYKQKVMISVKYLLFLADLLKKDKEANITIKTNGEYFPVTFENRKFRFIVAPRVEN